MKISHSWLKTYFEKEIPAPEKLADLFNLHAFEVEGIEHIKNDSILDIKVLPDRAHYALCHRGIAKEIQAISGLNIHLSALQKVTINPNTVPPKVDVKNIDLCNRYIARKIEHITVSDSPVFIKEPLEVIGQRSINTIVDATNFVMFDIGQPLHAFDADKVRGTIVVRFAEQDEKVTLLDNREVTLISTDLVIADEEGVLAIAGVKGGKKAEVTKDTKNIIVESANFNATAVRKTSTRLNLRNESSKRFENEITPDLCGEAMQKVTELIVRLSPEAKVGECVDVYPKPATSWHVSISQEQIASAIGVSISKKEIISILEKMNCVVVEVDREIIITPPLDRLDLKIPEDIADEVGRIYGYDKITSVLPPQLSENVLVSKRFYYAEKIKNILFELGYTEALLYSLVPKGHFEIAYPLASDKAALRESIIPKLQEVLTANARNADLLEIDIVKMFEIGKVFPKTGERTSLCFGVSIARKKKGVSAESIVKEAVASLEKALQVTISVSIDTKEVGKAVLEIDFDTLIEKMPDPENIDDLHFTAFDKDKKYIPFSPYPFASRDIAVFVPTEIEEKELADIIKSNAGSYLLKTKLFDVFKKEGRTSYAFRLIFQSYEKTLEEGEISGAMQAITKAFVDKGWEVR